MYRLSRSLHWERGLKQDHVPLAHLGLSRSLHWERGLKLCPHGGVGKGHGSLPSLGAWIETDQGGYGRRVVIGRSLHWERGLKQIFC